MLHLTILGADTQLGSSLCAACPQGPAGCCVAPPDADWSDIGRIVHGGGRDFLVFRVAAGDLVPIDKGLRLRRVKRREARTEPLERKCVFHGKGGCTITTAMRPATCNYFLCDDALGKGPPARTISARRAHAALRALFEGWDRDLAAEIPLRFPEGPPWDAAFLDWLGAAYEARLATAGAELAALADLAASDVG